MLSYQDLYEILRKEKYSETLQQLPNNFLEDLSEYLKDKKGQSLEEGDLLTDAVAKSKKQLENSLALFKDLILRRKKKMLNLIFVAAETGIMKRDYENMLVFEKGIFEKFVKAFEEGDKEITAIINKNKNEKSESKQTLVLFNQNVEQFVDLSGNVSGPFMTGELANLDLDVGKILVAGGKASFVDEN